MKKRIKRRDRTLRAQAETAELFQFFICVLCEFCGEISLPKKQRLFISKVVPWLALLGGIISSITVVLSFLLTLLSVIALDLSLILTMAGSFLLVLLNALFLIKAFKPLRKNNAVGWIYLFWANVLGVVNSIINIFVGDISGNGQILLTIFLTLVGFYLLFEIGSFYAYKNE